MGSGTNVSLGNAVSRPSSPFRKFSSVIPYSGIATLPVSSSSVSSWSFPNRLKSSRMQ